MTPSQKPQDGGAAPDPSKFHYYDQPQEYTVKLRVWGTASLTVSAASPDEARSKAEEIIDRDDFEVDLEECEDVEIDCVIKHPTRIYLVKRENYPGISATSRLMPGDEPREPSDSDRRTVEGFGYTPSWEAQP